MFDFYEKRKLKQIIFSKAMLALLLVVAAGLAWSVFGVFVKQRETTEIRKKREHELAALEERKHSLEEEIERLATERGAEAEIRSKFEVGHPGERVIVLVNPKEEENTSVAPPKQSIWERIRLFFKRE